MPSISSSYDIKRKPFTNNWVLMCMFGMTASIAPQGRRVAPLAIRNEETGILLEPDKLYYIIIGNMFVTMACPLFIQFNIQCLSLRLEGIFVLAYLHNDPGV